MRVEVYWNLHKKLFSVRALEGENKGRVIDHAYSVKLEEASFVVQPAGRERVRREGKKNVHAFVRGHLADYNHAPKMSYPVTYNPYMYDSFVQADTKKPVRWSPEVYMDVMLGKGSPYPRIQGVDHRMFMREMT
jgi:hypothetical protein